MSSWRTLFSSVKTTIQVKSIHEFLCCRYNKYSQITARAVRASFKEEERLAAERRGLTSLKFQRWENGLGGTQSDFDLLPQTPIAEEIARENAAAKSSS
ncbi:hypothetical protein H0H81_010066 [Sphagnurus paluster]|uniref:Uncharacterized protein n=1 Tax=Sphagnurus paluster TaxID=117069 RepID=A0A9P7GJA6_9AGAR|nr:hypothetical protein H0H81_010066 [Sphagnurus paluster]